MSFAVGMQVVCVNDALSPCPNWRAAVRAWPQLHGGYTIRAIREVGDLLG